MSSVVSVFVILDGKSEIDPNDESDMGKAMSSVVSVFVILDGKSEIDPNDESATFYAGARLVEAGKTTFADVFRVFYVMTLAAFSVSQFAPDTGKAMSSAVSVFTILDRKSEIDPNDESGITLDAVNGEIDFPESGSGKSTVISLQRFYNPDLGAITLDGVELQKFQLKWLRLRMGVVSQEPVLFNDTIRANISYGKHGQATKTEIIAASEFICGLHQESQDTTTGRGYKSSLDAESERVVQDALDMVMVNRTTVVVAHRLSTIKGADVIVVIKNGVIVEKGKREEFINIEEGFYTSLVALHLCSDIGQVPSGINYSKDSSLGIYRLETFLMKLTTERNETEQIPNTCYHFRHPKPRNMQSHWHFVNFKVQGHQNTHILQKSYFCKLPIPLETQQIEVSVIMTNGEYVKDMTSKFDKSAKFERQDFLRWQKKMHFLLTTLKVVYVLSTPSPVWSENETLETTRKRMKWENDDYICRGHILNGMSDSLFDIYQNAECAKALWESLEFKYMAEDASATKFLISNFMNYKMVDTRPVMEQYHEMLRILGQYTQHNLMTDEVISVAVIIDKRPPSWKEFKHGLKHKKKELNLVQLASHLRIEEGLRNQELDNNPKGKNQIGSSSVNMVERDGAENSNNNKNKRKFKSGDDKFANKKGTVTCWKCKKTDHMKKDCRSRKGNDGAGSMGLRILKSNNDEVAWWVDSGVTSHVCKDLRWFQVCKSIEDGSFVKMGNVATEPIKGIGRVLLTFTSVKTLCLDNVLYVPGIRKNLVSEIVLNKCGYKRV
nr:zinc finger, CCHC-type [Tanacetum cinerariifolium]